MSAKNTYYSRNRDHLLAQAKRRYRDDPQVVIESGRRSRMRHRAEVIPWLNAYRKTLRCSRCPETDWRCLDFHHPDPAEKRMDVSELVAQGRSLRIVRDEISKCEVLCANCHRMEHVPPQDGPGPKRRDRRLALLWFAGVKSGLRCQACPESRSLCLGFFRDGRRAGAKLSRMVKDLASRSRILEEIAASRILCFNCYRKEAADLRCAAA